VLAEYLWGLYTTQFGLKRDPLNDAVICELQSLTWSGNIRELSNAIARYVLLGTNPAMTTENPERNKRPRGLPASQSNLKRIARTAGAEMERNLITEALRANHWNRKRAAQDLKISYRALIYKIRGAGIGPRKGANCRQAAEQESSAKHNLD